MRMRAAYAVEVGDEVLVASFTRGVALLGGDGGAARVDGAGGFAGVSQRDRRHRVGGGR